LGNISLDKKFARRLGVTTFVAIVMNVYVKPVIEEMAMLTRSAHDGEIEHNAHLVTFP
jgi:hypothetical protein